MWLTILQRLKCWFFFSSGPLFLAILRQGDSNQRIDPLMAHKIA
jgi:hypothetical protein